MDTLALWGFNRDDQLIALSFGNSVRRSSADTRFRVRNQSIHYIAQGVIISVTGDDPSQFYLSTDGVTFAATVNLGDLHPLAVSGIIWLRRVTPSTATLGARTNQLRAAATAWQSPIL